MRFDVKQGPKAVNIVKVSTKKAAGKVRAKKVDAGKTGIKKSAEKNVVSGIKKQYLKSGVSCNVTFRLPKEAAPDAQSATIVGDFNNWNLTDTQMKKLKSGDFEITLKLHKDKEYRFKYFIDGSQWENDWYAYKYVPNQHGSDDSLVIL